MIMIRIYIILLLSITMYYNSNSQPLLTKNYQLPYIQKANESDIKSRAFIISPAVAFGKSNNFGLDVGYGIKHDVGTGGGGYSSLNQVGFGYMQTFNNAQHYLRVYTEIDYMFLMCLPPPSLSIRFSYLNGYFSGTNEQYIISEIGYHLVYGDISACFPAALQRAHNLYFCVNIRGHIFAKIKKSQKRYIR